MHYSAGMSDTNGTDTESESWPEFVKRCSENATPTAIGAKIGVSHSTVLRWLDGSSIPGVDQAVDFARRYNQSPIAAFIALGWIRADEVGAAIEIATSLRNVSDAALMGELADRLGVLRRLQGHDAQDWPPPGWRSDNPGVGRVQDGDKGQQLRG